MPPKKKGKRKPKQDEDNIIVDKENDEEVTDDQQHEEDLQEKQKEPEDEVKEKQKKAKGKKKHKKHDAEKENLMSDSLVEEEKAADVSIDIDDSPDTVTRPRSSSLKEVVVDSKESPKDVVAIDIPDSPTEKGPPRFPVDDPNNNSSFERPSSRPTSPQKIPSRPTSAENVLQPEKFPSRPGSVEKLPSRPTSAENLLQERDSSRPTSPEKVSSRPPSVQNEKTSSRPTSPEKKTSRPSSADNILYKGEKIPSRPTSAAEKVPLRPSSAENVLVPENLSSRPTSAEKRSSRTASAENVLQQERILSRPTSAEKLASRPSSAQKPSSVSPLAQIEKDSSRPASANKPTSRPPSADKLSSRPTSAEKISSRPSSRQRPPSSEKIFSREHTNEAILENPETTNLPPRESPDYLMEYNQGAEMVTEERPSSKERKKKRSSKMSVDGQLVTSDRPSSAAKEKRSSKSSDAKRVSISNVVEEKQFPMEDGTGEIKRRELEPNALEEDDNNNDLTFEPPPEKERRRSSLPKLAEDDELPWAMYKQMKTRRDEEEEEKNEEMDGEDSDNDDKYEPPTVEDLPDMYNAMEGLDTDGIELNMKTSPPSILDNEQQRRYQQQVHDLKQGLAEEEIKVYLDEFEQRVEEEILMIGNISLDDVQDEEQRLREEHISFQQQQAKVQRNRQQEIMQAMERAKKYVMHKYKEKHKELRMREEHLMQKDRSYKDEIHRAFRRSESQLRKALKRRKAEVKTMYGDLTFADGQYGGSKGRRWKIDWNRAPQPIQIKLKCLRGVKDKLPSSRYVLMVSLYNRLGGNVMKWSNLKGQQWGGATLPLQHDGEFFNIEMKVDQSVFTVCPSKPDMLPGMILVFELFILRGSVTPTDKVVGWGCFPICDADFNVIEGKYKTPILRGDMDPGLDNFQTIEKLMAEDLEHWLCNFYFEIVKLPRYMAGQKEYEVELQFTSGLLSSPDRTRTNEENVDGEKAIFGSRQDMQSQMSFEKSRVSLRSMSSEPSTARLAEESSSSSSDKKPMLTVSDSSAGSSSGSSEMRKSSLMHDSQIQMLRAENLSQNLRKRKNSGVGMEIDEPYARPMTSVAASRKLVEERGLQLSDDENSSGTDYDEDDIYTLKRTEGFKPVKGQPGMFYKIHHNTPSDVYAKKIYTMMPKTPLLAKQKVKKKLTHLEELNTHSFTVKTPWSNKGRIDNKGSRKIQYIGRMLLTELGISQIKSRVFWAMVLMLLVTFWVRMYLHYIGQWVALVAFEIPINKFEFLPYTVNLNYQNTLLRTREELALIVIGPFTSILLFAILVAISAFVQFLFDRFPNILSRFIMAFGIQCVLDPVFILIVDSAMKRYENTGGPEPIGDAFKLYWHFDRFYNNANVTLFISIALTVFLYFVTTFCACALLYVYFLKIHNNGRLMDVYWRLHSKEQDFFIPYDLEVSNEELNFVCRKAEQWRGEEGERRKTAVYDYIWEEEEMTEEDWDNPDSGSGKKTGAKETTTHVSIHTLHLDGLRELYRHFLRLPDGAIVEVFGEMNIPGIDEGVKQALIKRTTFQSMHNNDNNNGVDGLRKRNPASLSGSHLSVRNEDIREKKMSTGDYLLGVPSASSQV